MSSWRSRSLHAPLLSLVGALGCGSSPLGLELVIPSDVSSEELSFIALTAVGPTGLRPKPDGSSERFVLGCPDLSAFVPTALASENGRLAGSAVDVYLDRRRVDFAEGRENGLSIPEPTPNADRNPWGALLVQVEVGGPSSFPGLLPGLAPREHPWLHGCFCFRTEPEASHDDPVLDDAVKSACPPRSTFGERVQLDLGPLASAAFSPRPAGPVAQVISPGSRRLIDPGVVVEARRCAASGFGDDCFACDDACPELGDLSGLPLLARLVSADGAELSLPASVLVTETDGTVRPDVEVIGCRANVTLRLSVPGRPASAVDFELACAPSLRPRTPRALDAPLGAEAPLLAYVPGDPSRAHPPLLARTSRVGADARLELYGLEGAQLVALTSTTFASEEPRGLLGFHLQPSGRSRALLAVMSSVAAGPSTRLRVLEPSAQAGGSLQLAGRLDGPCPRCACREAGCGLCETPAPGRVDLRASLVDEDELADLSYSVEGAVELVTVYSRGWVAPAPSEPLRLPPLSDHCLGQGVIRPLNGFEFLELGGVEVGPRGPADLVTAEAQGLYLRYDLGPAASDAECRLPNLDCQVGPRCPAACEAPQTLAALVDMSDVRRLRLRSGKEESDLAAVGVERSRSILQLVYGRAQAFSGVLSHSELRERVVKLALDGSFPTGGGRPRKLAVGDLNGDGHEDLVVWRPGTEERRIWLGGADVPLEVGAEALGRAPGLACLSSDLALGDLDGDGADELIVGCADGRALVW